LKSATVTPCRGRGIQGGVAPIDAYGDITATVTDADIPVFAWETAVIVTGPELGTVAGAVYRPEVEIVPTVELPPVAPFTSHVTAVLEFPDTTAANCCDSLVDTVAPVGDIHTFSEPDVTTMFAEEELVLLAFE
jgi:hypothetical protein